MKQILMIMALFLVTQVLGLYVGTQYIGEISSGAIPPVFENPQSVETSLYLFGYIIATTAVMLVLIRFRRNFIRILEAFVIFTTSWVTLGFLLPVDAYLVLALAIALTAWKAFRPSILNQDIAAVLSGAGVGALLGASLGVVPALVFMLILSAYDFVSVFITKHMVYMAKALIERPTAFTIAAPPNLKTLTNSGKVSKGTKKFHVFQLGVGDMVMPLMFSVSVLGTFGLASSIASVAGATVALFSLIYFMSGKPRPLPALPFITFGTLAGFLLSTIL